MQQASAPWASSTHRSIYWLASNETKGSRYCTWCYLGTCGKEIMVSCDTCWCTWIKFVHCLVHVVSLCFIFCSPHLEVPAPGSTRTHQEGIHRPIHPLNHSYPAIPAPNTHSPQSHPFLPPPKKKRAERTKSTSQKTNLPLSACQPQHYVSRTSLMHVCLVPLDP